MEGEDRRPARSARRAPAPTRRLRSAFVALALLVVAGGIVTLVTAPSPVRASATGGNPAARARSGSPQTAGSTTTVALPSSSTTLSPATTIPPAKKSPPTTVAPPTTVVPRTTTTTTIPLATRVPRPPAPPATVPATGVFTSSAIASYLAAAAKASLDVTATVFDASNAQTSTYWPALRLNTASSIKLDILEVLLDHAQASGTPLSAEEHELATKMIEDSTNTAAQTLWDAEGGAAAVSAYDAAAGLSETVPNGPGYWGLSTSGASDLVRLMSDAAFPGSLLDGSSRQLALGLLTHVLPTQAWGGSAGVPAGVRVAIKNGWLRIDGRWEVNTTAWVDGDGRDYVVAVMSWGDATVSAGIGVVGGLCARIWSALAPA